METVREVVDINTSDGPMASIVYRPADGNQYPAVIVIEEIFGVNDHIQDVARRFAAEGYVAAAPDLFHRAGRLLTVPYSDMPGTAKLREGLTEDHLVGDLSAVVAYLQSSPSVSRPEVGITGYCYGGRVSYLAACRVEGIGAAAVYYGGGIVPRPDQPVTTTPLIELTDRITCPVIGFFGGQDGGIPVEAVDRIRDTLKEKGKTADIFLYPDAGHGFFCDDREGSYNKEAAGDAWDKTLAFFHRHLKGAAVTTG